MRPKTKLRELLTLHDVKTYLHNKFVERLGELREAFKVSPWKYQGIFMRLMEIQATPGKISVTVDGWTADTTSQGFLGMTAHWIEVKREEAHDGEKKEKEVWLLQSTVIGFCGISGSHDSENLGWYFVGTTDCIGITGRNSSKVSIPCTDPFPY